MSEDNKINMFVMNRDFVVNGFGHVVAFEKDVPVRVPPILHTEAMRCGAIALDDTKVDHVQKPGQREPEIQGEERSETIERAMDRLVKENLRMSFGADGLPTTKAIFRLTGIDLEQNERNAIWQARMKKIVSQNDPNNNTITEEETAEIAADAADKEAENVEAEAAEEVAGAEGPGTEEVELAEPEKEPKVAPAKKTVKKKAARAKK